VHATRKPKAHTAAETLYGRWRAEATERGHDPDTLVRQVTGRTPDRGQELSERTVAEVFDRLACPDGLTTTASTFARQDVIAALGGQLAGATRTELEGLADRFLAERTVVVVADRALDERRWSTAELLAVEQRLVASATGHAGEQTAMCPTTPSGPPWLPIRPLARTSEGWSATSARVVPALPSSWVGPGPARPSWRRRSRAAPRSVVLTLWLSRPQRSAWAAGPDGPAGGRAASALMDRWAGARLGLRDERSEDLPLGIGEVGAVAAAPKHAPLWRRGTAKRRSLLPSLPPSRL
jgi:hypothetical protein